MVEALGNSGNPEKASFDIDGPILEMRQEKPGNKDGGNSYHEAERVINEKKGDEQGNAKGDDNALFGGLETERPEGEKNNRAKQAQSARIEKILPFAEFRRDGADRDTKDEDKQHGYRVFQNRFKCQWGSNGVE